MIKVTNLEFNFGSNKLFNKINFEIASPCLTYLMGKSGSGKSVLLRILCKKYQPSSGTILLEQTPVLVFQQPILIDSMTVEENLEIVCARKLTKNDYARVRLDQSIENQLPNNLSYGQRKKLLILRALLRNPKLIFFDEPTTGLDRPTARELSSLFRDIHVNEKISMMIVSHDIYCALSYSKEILFLENKEIIFQGSSEEIKSSKENIIQEFICSQ